MKKLGLVGDLLLVCVGGYIWESVRPLSKGKGHFQLLQKEDFILLQKARDMSH